jgi:SAM-dependent methyltransferase
MPTEDSASPSFAWSEELEELHEESSRTHSIDVWSRYAMLSRLTPLPPNATVVDVGCSTGYLLEDLRELAATARLVGLDLIFSGLHKAHAHLPDALIVQADACHLPLPDSIAHALLSANLLEHVPSDIAALREICRVLRPGGTAILAVPIGPGTYDYYDRFLGHQRRYARGELATKARAAGLTVTEDLHLCAPMFPAFWAVKKWNRWRFGRLSGEALKRRVAHDIASTHDSKMFALACDLDRWMLAHGIHLPFGIRGLTVARRPDERLR